MRSKIQALVFILFFGLVMSSSSFAYYTFLLVNNTDFVVKVERAFEHCMDSNPNYPVYVLPNKTAWLSSSEGHLCSLHTTTANPCSASFSTNERVLYIAYASTADGWHKVGNLFVQRGNSDGEIVYSAEIVPNNPKNIPMHATQTSVKSRSSTVTFDDGM